MSKNYLKTLLLFLPIALLAQKPSGKFYSIPAAFVPLETTQPEGLDTAINNDFALVRRPKHVQVNAFEISKQVTLKEYKVFLEAMRAEHGDDYYRSLLPDTTIGTAEQYNQYLTDPAFNDFPVVGVSWNNAMRYCAWLSLEENDGLAMAYYYRLPTRSEWLSACNFLSDKKGNDFNKNYADWLMNAYFENAYSFVHDLNPDVRPPSDDMEANAKRKLYAGNSYHTFFQDPASFTNSYEYYTSGLPFLGFRRVKVEANETSFTDYCLYLSRYWGFKY